MNPVANECCNGAGRGYRYKSQRTAVAELCIHPSRLIRKATRYTPPPPTKTPCAAIIVCMSVRTHTAKASALTGGEETFQEAFLVAKEDASLAAAQLSPRTGLLLSTICPILSRHGFQCWYCCGCFTFPSFPTRRVLAARNSNTSLLGYSLRTCVAQEDVPFVFCSDSFSARRKIQASGAILAVLQRPPSKRAIS